MDLHRSARHGASAESVRLRYGWKASFFRHHLFGLGMRRSICSPYRRNCGVTDQTTVAKGEAQEKTEVVHNRGNTALTECRTRRQVVDAPTPWLRTRTNSLRSKPIRLLVIRNVEEAVGLTISTDASLLGRKIKRPSWPFDFGSSEESVGKSKDKSPLAISGFTLPFNRTAVETQVTKCLAHL